MLPDLVTPVNWLVLMPVYVKVSFPILNEPPVDLKLDASAKFKVVIAPVPSELPPPAKVLEPA